MKLEELFENRDILAKKNDIDQFEKIDPSHSVTSIGFSTKSKKWYGWSHRAICGFGIGDKIFDEQFGDEKTPYTKHGSKPIKTLKDAKQSAINFANSVA